MDFYTRIHAWYDQVFPYSPAQRDYVLSFGADLDLSLADIGCGTATLAIALSKQFHNVIAMDPDPAMLRAAQTKAAEQGSGLVLLQGGMLDLTHLLPPDSLDRLVCFGNTLPHLASEEEVREFVRQARIVLKRTGLFLLQVINYDRILDQGMSGLPTIENEHIRFERYYEYPENPTLVAFRTRLTLKATGEVIENVVPLLAIRPGKIKGILNEAGFKTVRESGSFTGDPFTSGSQPYILAAT